MRRKKNAIKKRKIKRGNKSKHTNRNVVRQTPKTSGGHSIGERKEGKNKEKGLNCSLCGEPIDLGDPKQTIKYTNELYFYYCKCSLTTLPLHIKTRKEN